MAHFLIFTTLFFLLDKFSLFNKSGTLKLMIEQAIDNIIINKEIAKLKASTQYLSQIFHYSYPFPLIYNLAPHEKLCSFSLCKCIVQLAYLIFTASRVQTDIWIEKQPIFILKNPSEGLYSINIRFLINKELESGASKIRKTQIAGFIKINSYSNSAHRNQLTIELIRNLVENSMKMIPQKPSSELQNKKIINNLIKQYETTIEPSLKHQSNKQIIKYFEETELFSSYSNLLQVLKNSFVYKIIEDFQKKQMINEMVKSFQANKRLQPFQNVLLIHSKMIDEVLLQFMEVKLIYMEKSSTKDYKDSHGLAIGYIEGGPQEKQSQLVCYRCRFYSLELGYENKESSESNESELESKRIHYFLEYNLEERYIICRIITNLEETPETIDVISNYMHNTCFQDDTVSLEIFEVVKHTMRGHTMKKFLTFKGIYTLDYKQHPIGPIFLLMELLTLHYLVYFQFFVKKPKKLLHKDIVELKDRVLHLKAICLRKAEDFYSRIFKSFYS